MKTDRRYGYELTHEQIAAFREAGYLVLPPIIQQEEVECMRESVDTLLELNIGLEQWDEEVTPSIDTVDKVIRYRHLIKNVHLLKPKACSAAYIAITEEIARQLLGEGATFAGSYCFYKPPLVGVTTPWHQDAAYIPKDSSIELLSFWMPLQESTIESGCMQFIPGSHRWEILPHRHLNDDPNNPVLVAETSYIELSHITACPLRAGAVTIHNGRIMHYSGPNISSSPRHALILDFFIPGFKG